MLQQLEKFLDALWPQTCLACGEDSSLQTFCFYCEPSIELADPEHEAIFEFSGPIRKIIQKIKFHKNETKARRLVSYAVRSFSNLEIEYEGISFVPVHWRRRLSRGFDLSAIFALELSKKLKVPICDYLQNTRLDPPLTLASSKEERIKLTKNRYKLRIKNAQPKKLLLIDDVMTTGATLDSAKTLLETAEHEVTCLALAKTPIRNYL